MANKRMFSNDVLDTDAFLDMPLSAQALYFHLNLRADDDGFISKPKRIQQYVGASLDDLKILVEKRFVIAFEDGVIVIKHWRMHNTIQKDRYKPTNYQEDLSMLGIKENKAYTLDVSKMETECIQNVSTDIGIDKDIDKDIDIDLVIGKEEKPNRKRFVPPSLDQVREFIQEKNLDVNAESFFYYYQSNGWKVGKNSMKDWNSTLYQWNAREKKSKPKEQQSIADKWANV